jgi:hypothetical protein
MSRISLPDGSQWCVQLAPGPKSKSAPSAALPRLVGTAGPLLSSEVVAVVLSTVNPKEKKCGPLHGDGHQVGYGTQEERVVRDRRVYHEIGLVQMDGGDQQLRVDHG